MHINTYVLETRKFDIHNSIGIPDEIAYDLWALGKIFEGLKYRKPEGWRLKGRNEGNNWGKREF